MTQSWPLSDVQNQFNEVITNAERGEAQIIITQGVPAVVVLAYAEYQRLIARTSRLSTFMQTFPHDGENCRLCVMIHHCEMIRYGELALDMHVQAELVTPMPIRSC